MNVQTQNRWLTIKDVAKPTSEGGYGIAPSTQARMRMNGAIPFSKIGGKMIRYDRRRLDEWLEKHTVPTAG